MARHADTALEPLTAEMAALLAELQQRLKAKGLTVATAESCTGGLLATYLTHLPGSSAVYVGGVAAYANAAKTALLGVEADLLAAHGAVSAAVAAAMARGACARLASDLALALTGVAGPDGGSPEKPVGLVYCGIAAGDSVRVVRWQLPGGRSAVRQAAALGALQELLAEVKAGH